MPSYKDENTGKWYCSFYYTDLRGKRVRKLKRGFALKRDADKWEREFLSTEHPDEITVKTLINEYLNDLDYRLKINDIKQSTYVVNKSTIRLYIKDYWSNIIASKVSTKDVKEWISSITEKEPTNQNTRYRKEHDWAPRTKRSAGTLNRAKNTLRAVFQQGVLNHGLKSNPVDNVPVIKIPSENHRAKFWTLEQYEAFRKLVKRSDMKTMFDIMFYAGLRLGEVMALTIKDIQPYSISVSKSLIETMDHDIYIDTPKTKASIRIVQIPTFLYENIVSYSKEIYNLKNTDLLFNVNRETLRACLNSTGNRAGNPPISPHVLRHSYASHLMQLTDITTVASLLGHSNANTTLQVYAHMLPNADRNAVDAFEKMATKNKK